MKKFKLKLLLALLVCGSAYAQQRDAYVAIGDIYCSDGSIVTPEAYPSSGKTGQGVVCYVDATGRSGWVVHYQHSSSNLQWSTEYVNTGVTKRTDIRDFDDAANGLIKDCDGAANTAKIAAISGYETKYPAFNYAKGLGIGWYVPAAGQLNYMIAHTAVLNASLQLISGYNLIMRGDSNTAADFNRYYWSSDEATSSGNSLAWYLNTDCSFVSVSKSDASRRVRAFRNFSLSAKGNREGTYRIGGVITFNDGTQGVVFSLNRERTAGTVVAMNDYNNTDRSWSAGYDHVPYLDEVRYISQALSHKDGYANTCAVRYEADRAGSDYAYPAFKLLLDNGYTVSGNTATFSHGWYQPSAGQLREIFGALSIAGFEDALTEETMGNYNYHSSNEYGDLSTGTGLQNADFPNSLNQFWACTFRNGRLRALRKNSYENINGTTTYHRNRAVRDFPEASAVAITVNSNNAIYGRGLGSDSYLTGKTVLIGAKPEKGYQFAYWDDDHSNTENPRTISVSAAATYTAVFEAIADNFTLTVGTCDETMGSATGGGSYQCGQTATISASPAAGYKFVRWSDGNTQASRTVTVYADATYTAAFALDAEDAPRVHPGDILCTDGATVAPEGYVAYTAAHEGVTAKAVVYYVDRSGQHGYALHPKTYSWCWGARNIDIPELPTTTDRIIAMRDTIGSANTDKICAFFGDCTVAASLCRSFGPEWFLPSEGQLNYFYASLPKVQQGLDAIIDAGGIASRWPEDNSWFNWSSSEYSATVAWSVIYNGRVYSNGKDYDCRASASCAF